MKKNNHRILINFLKNQPIEIISGNLYINISDDEDWEILDNDSISNFEHSIIKIFDTVAKKEFFMFLVNASITIKNNIAQINTFSNSRIFIKDKKKVNYKEQIRSINKEINDLEILKNIGMGIDDFITLEEYKSQLYELKMMQFLNLVEENKYE
ncbi:MSC_0621 family F1-like ATPase epsilon subunit [Mycoplasma phocoeninasale]|uniref:Uncharacterized protein n=1 Tax=Mycoplasma phocoeninasale TaxID=2726117 RepID=A0A858U1D4_9MOLU|nr:hypothetical protein [Mycoplasma phocoeninasale]MBN0970629.1 hypothetical protein [Mycoplasma phocoeninasale]QJG66260.1 hypothetical protein HGG64_00835 [Mycoplasma phocoeninasale]